MSDLSPASVPRRTIFAADGIAVLALSLSLVICAWTRWLPLDRTEAFGFATGAICVWLATKENLWSWPIGLANNLVFAVLFWNARLFGDLGLQGVYFVLGIWGWHQWLSGGRDRQPLPVSRTTLREWLGIAVFLLLGTWGLHRHLVAIQGSAPFWDALSTILSLAAQYLLSRKRIENWWLWIAADLIYVPLYASKGLPLTALLYAGFIVLCVLGLLRWRRELTRRFGLGVVIGKFLPPHHGHRFLIETALTRCDLVVVIVCGKPFDPIPPELRADWLREIVPAAKVLLIDDRYDENDSRVWAENTLGWLGRAPDAVFTSEDYGERYAAHLGCAHVMVDRARLTVPCSGTAVRADPLAMWPFIDPPVRAWFVRRVVILGAESTGTTTLAMDLAAALETAWVAEYGREYSARKQAAGDTHWHSDEFLEIAAEQTRREDLAGRLADRVLICDTNAFATVLWHRRYMGGDDPRLTAFAARCRADLYVLTGDEIPFVQDGLRDGEHLRHEMHHWFEEALAAQPVPWLQVRGSPQERLLAVLQRIERDGLVPGKFQQDPPEEAHERTGPQMK